MVDNTVYHFVGFNLGVEIFLKKREHQKKESVGNRRLRHLCTLCILVSRNWNLDNFIQVVQSPKNSNLMGYFCPKSIFTRLKIIYKGFIKHYYCLKIHQISHVIFETISHFSQQNYFKIKST